MKATYTHQNRNVESYLEVEVEIAGEFQVLVQDQHPGWTVTKSDDIDIDCIIVDLAGETVCWVEIKDRNYTSTFFKNEDILCPLRKVTAARSKSEPVFFLNRTSDGVLVLFDLKNPTSIDTFRGCYTSSRFNQEEARQHRPDEQLSGYWEWESNQWIKEVG